MESDNEIVVDIEDTTLQVPSTPQEITVRTVGLQNFSAFCF
jgi:hypothetical protein